MPCLADFLRFSGIFQVEQRDFRNGNDPCIIKFGNPFHVMPCASHAGPQRLDVVTVVCANRKYAILKLEHAMQRVGAPGKASKVRPIQYKYFSPVHRFQHLIASFFN